MVIVNYTFSITAVTFTAEFFLNGFHLTEISAWLAFLSFLFSFFHLCCFSSTAVKKMCLLDISNSLKNSKKNFFSMVFHSCCRKIRFLGDWPLNCIELLRELCAWENFSWTQKFHLIIQSMTRLFSPEFLPLIAQCENLYSPSIFTVWVIQWVLNDNLENIQ